MNKGKKCVLFAQEIGMHNERSGYSVGSQKNQLKEYALKKGLQIEKTFNISDNIEDGFEIFEDMLSFIKLSDIDIVVVVKNHILSMMDTLGIDSWLNEDKNRELHIAETEHVITKERDLDKVICWDADVALAKYYFRTFHKRVVKATTIKKSLDC